VRNRTAGFEKRVETSGAPSKNTINFSKNTSGYFKPGMDIFNYFRKVGFFPRFTIRKSASTCQAGDFRGVKAPCKPSKSMRKKINFKILKNSIKNALFFTLNML
jgi:hypothetical protein